MADFSDLPDIDVTASAFRSNYDDLLALKVDRSAGVLTSAASTRAIAAWANLVDGAVAVIQERLAEASVDGRTRVGLRWIHQVAADPEGVQAGSPGDVALSDAGTVFVKVTGTATDTGWVDLRPRTATQDVTGGGTTSTIDWTDGQYHRVNLDAAGASVAFTLSNPANGASYTVALVLEDDGETHATTWPSPVVWSGGIAPPSLDTTGAATWHNILVRFVYNATEARYYGTWDEFSDA